MLKSIKLGIIGYIILLSMYAVDFAIRRKKETAFLSISDKIAISLYSICLAFSVLFHYLIERLKTQRSHTLVKCLLVIYIIVLILKEQLFDLEADDMCTHCFIFFYFVLTFIVAHRIEFVYVVHVVFILMFVCYASGVIRTYHEAEK